MTHHVSIEFLLALLIRFVSFVCIMWKHILWILIILQKEAFSRFRYPTSFHLQVFTYWNKLWPHWVKKMSFHIIHILVLDEDSSHWRQVNTWTYKYTNMIDLFGFFLRLLSDTHVVPIVLQFFMMCWRTFQTIILSAKQCVLKKTAHQFKWGIVFYLPPFWNKFAIIS